MTPPARQPVELARTVRDLSACDRGITVPDETTSLDAELDRAVLAYAERWPLERIAAEQQARGAHAYAERFTLSAVESRRAH
jgi:hypothetical protein